MIFKNVKIYYKRVQTLQILLQIYHKFSPKLTAKLLTFFPDAWNIYDTDNGFKIFYRFSSYW